jgi:CRP-like cAMP-binding protein
MFDIFETYITSKAAFTKEELKYMRSLATEKKVRRRELLLRDGEVCRFKIFIATGLLRTYCKKDDGMEYNMGFAPECSWTTDAESFHKQTPSLYTIEALEDSAVIMWSKEHVEELFAALPAFKDYSDKLIYNNLQASRDRIRMNISYTAEEKYQEFMQSFPDVFNRVPLHMVASYLGVSRETLTRIRRKLWGIEER